MLVPMKETEWKKCPRPFCKFTSWDDTGMKIHTTKAHSYEKDSRRLKIKLKSTEKSIDFLAMKLEEKKKDREKLLEFLASLNKEY